MIDNRVHNRTTFYTRAIASKPSEMNLHSASSTWSLYRQLLEVVNASVFGRAEDLYQDLEATLRRHKPDLLTLAEKPVNRRLHRTLCSST